MSNANLIAEARRNAPESVDESLIMRLTVALEAAEPRTVTTTEELGALREGSVVMGFDKWDHDPIVSTKQYGEWSLAGSGNGYQYAGLDQACDELTVLHEPTI